MFNQMMLQRYMPGDRALQVLNDNGLYFRRVDGYPEDLTEGDREHFGRNELLIVESLNAKVAEPLRMSVEEARTLAFEMMNKDKKDLFIQSWFWDTKMSRFMWDSYAGFSNSPDCALFVMNRFSIGSYFDQVLPAGFRFEPVKYVEDKMQHKDAFFTKGADFHPESEYRISIDVRELAFYNPKILPEYGWISRRAAHSTEMQAEDFRTHRVANEDLFRCVDEFGFILSVPLSTLLEAVLIPTQASPEFAEMFNEQLARMGCKFTCQRVDVPEQ
ncbi:hypothetical protein V2J80_06920 [Pseudomonas alliivorans]|nr:hypothetical protein [Pseudomonas alliivorans]MEE5163037.1 hypothetical protein [Pseudomonas alliivorans]